MRSRSLVTSVAITILLTACSGGTSSTDSTATASTTGDSTAASVAPLTPEQIAASTDFCALQAGLDGLDSPFDNSASTPADFEAWFNGTVRPAIAKLLELAPAEITDDVATLTEGLNRFADKFEEHGYDVATAYKDPEMQKIAQNEDYNAAGDAVDEYCGN